MQQGDDNEYLKSYEYSCNYWVNSVYCHNDNGRLFWAIEYIDSEGHTELFHTHQFDIDDAKRIRVKWKRDERISKATFYTDQNTLAVKQMTFEFSSGRKANCNLGQDRPKKRTLHELSVNLSGEIAGFEYLKLASGIRVKNVIERN